MNKTKRTFYNSTNTYRKWKTTYDYLDQFQNALTVKLKFLNETFNEFIARL